METMPSAAILEPGPIYFFDQLKTRKKERSKKIPAERPTDFSSFHTHLQWVGLIPSLVKCKKTDCREDYMERNEDSFLKDDTERRVKHPVVCQTSAYSLFNTKSEDPNSKISQMPSTLPEDEDPQLSQLDEYRYTVLTMLQELAEILHFFTSYEIIFPQGLINVLNYSWRELSEGADYSKWCRKSLTCESQSLGRGQALDEYDKMVSRSECISYETAENAKVHQRKSGVLHGAKEKRNLETASNRTLGNKAPVAQHATQLPVTISFSLSSKHCEERGWIFQRSDSKSEDLDWKIPYVWAVERLGQAQLQINDQLSKLKAAGFDKPVILRHYGDGGREIFNKKFKRESSKTFTFELLNGKPQIPTIKQMDPAWKKLHYGLIDGSSLVYYPSEHLAACQSYSDLPGGGVYTNIFSDSPSQTILGTFTPSGHGSICFSNSNTVAMMFNQQGGMMTNKDGEIIRKWKWPREGNLSEPVIIQVNEYITVRIAGRFAINMVYKWQHESVRLSLSPVQGTSPPQLEDLAQIVTRINFSSKSAKDFCNENRKKLKEKETKKVQKKESRLAEPLKTLEILEENISHRNYFSAARELRKLQQKIKNILDDWMEYYQMALGIDSDIHKMPDLTPRTLRKCQNQSVDIPLANSTVWRPQEERREDSTAAKSESPLLLDCFQLAPACNMQWEPSSYSPRVSTLLTSSINVDVPHVTQFNLNKSTHVLQNFCSSGDNVFVSACPAVLRRKMMGQEGKLRRCSNHQMPCVSDLEYDHLINNQMSSQEQILVVCVSSSLQTNEDPREDELEQLYEKKNRNRSMPCVQGRLDSFRLLKYDISTADEFTGHKGSLLVQRHNVAPGMFLMSVCSVVGEGRQAGAVLTLQPCQMYIQGKLIFANYIFNGYSKSVKDLQKQIAKTRSDYRMGYCLPKDFKFSS
ncbi:uncharacterized protein LOC102568548 [Alligator mississippiensis]|uniref:FAM194 C-terminal domain-containing protein n=1 Tax=Alligator mississippiensis TaxID=8496 RepID=A0A151NHB2_ALLMI|nr:uncharacterized protein LOC102568548 [Alligator mississippiensis]KYO36211.1 hypothetical protein Y1Q_0024005 [Alligator mississippiensis]